MFCISIYFNFFANSSYFESVINGCVNNKIRFT